MKNWRKILVTGMVAGMIAVTGCSSSVPEVNQGNRNGQRVVDAVNGRTDSYSFNRARTRNTGERTMRGFNRGFRRAARTNNNNVTRARLHDGATRNRHHNNAINHGLGLDGSSHYRHPGQTTGTARQVPNRSTNTLNRGRVGHTFGYDQHAYGVDGEYGYDLGQRANTRVNDTAKHKASNFNNCVVRRTPPRSTVAHNTTKKAAHPTRKAATATQPTRSTTRKAAHTTTVKPATRAGRVSELRNNVRNIHSQNTNHSVVSPIMNASPVVNPYAMRNNNRTNIGQNRSSRRAEARRVGTNGTGRRAHASRRPSHVNINDYNLAHRGINNSMYLGSGFYMSNDEVHDRTGGAPYNQQAHGSVSTRGQVMPVNTIDDVNDYAFFKRNKVNDTAPVTPEPTNGPSAPAPNRTRSVNRVRTATPAPVNSPVPTSLGYDGYDSSYDDMHNVDDYDNHSSYDTSDFRYNSNHQPANGRTAPARSAGQRAMK